MGEDVSLPSIEEEYLVTIFDQNSIQIQLLLESVDANVPGKIIMEFSEPLLLPSAWRNLGKKRLLNDSNQNEKAQALLYESIKISMKLSKHSEVLYDLESIPTLLQSYWLESAIENRITIGLKFRFPHLISSVGPD